MFLTKKDIAKGLKSAGFSNAEIGRRLGVAASTAACWVDVKRREARRKLSSVSEEAKRNKARLEGSSVSLRDRAIELKGLGHSCRSVSRRLGVSHSTVARWVSPEQEERNKEGGRARRQRRKESETEQQRSERLSGQRGKWRSRYYSDEEFRKRSIGHSQERQGRYRDADNNNIHRSSLIRVLEQRDGEGCNCCGGRAEPEIDHIVSIREASELGWAADKYNNVNNLQILCGSRAGGMGCNQSKGDGAQAEFIAKRLGQGYPARNPNVAEGWDKAWDSRFGNTSN